jgi:hypothetical protein
MIKYLLALKSLTRAIGEEKISTFCEEKEWNGNTRETKYYQFIS